MTIEKQIDELTKEQFRFWINGNTIVLDAYYLFSRENKRKRNYNFVKRYERLSDRNTFTPLQEVPLTEEIRNEAKLAFIRTLEVMTWEEYKR